MTMTNDDLIAIVDEFADALAAEPRERERIRAATGGLIMALADLSSVQSASSVRPLFQRQDMMQRHMEAEDVRQDMLEADANADNVRISDMERSIRRQRTEDDVQDQHMEQIDDRLDELEHPHEAGR